MHPVESFEPVHSEQFDELPPAVPEPVGAAELAAVRQTLEQVRDELKASNERAAARERIIDRLHEENQRLRAGERQLLLRPILVDLQQLRNGLLREAGRLPADYTARQAAGLLASFAEGVELALERGGVRVLRPAAGDPFDPALHRASAVVPAANSDQDGTIDSVAADGYLDVVTERTLSPATVAVRRWAE